jgi:hypothetical protein
MGIGKLTRMRLLWICLFKLICLKIKPDCIRDDWLMELPREIAVRRAGLLDYLLRSLTYSQ